MIKRVVGILSLFGLIAAGPALALTIEAGDTAPTGSTPMPYSKGSGSLPGFQGNFPAQQVYWAKDGLLLGWDWFAQGFNEYFPAYFPGQAGSLAPGQVTIDMAYTVWGAVRWDNVVVPTSGMYQVAFRYAYDPGIFPGVTDRPAQVVVDNQIVVPLIHFPITGAAGSGFSTFCHSWANIQLSAGKHQVILYNGGPTFNGGSGAHVARLDDMTVQPSTGATPPTTTKTQCNSSY